MTKRKIIGILGGMGPQASCELYNLINKRCVSHYKIKKNSEFPYLRISNIPVPDLISDKSNEKETVSLVHSEAEILVHSGVTDILMPCNTMHLYEDEITKDLDTKFHPLPKLVISEIKSKAFNKVLILGSLTTLEDNLYQKQLEEKNIDYIEPSRNLKLLTSKLILNAISNRTEDQSENEFFSTIEKEASENKVEGILLGCTELPIVFKNYTNKFFVFNSLQILANKICEIHFENKIV